MSQKPPPPSSPPTLPSDLSLGRRSGGTAAAAAARAWGSYPEHTFVGEETSGLGGDLAGAYVFGDQPTWFIDPLDGTTNFVTGQNDVVVSIALWTKGKAQLAIIFNPFVDELYTAIAGQGAFCNGVRIGVSQETALSKTVVMNNIGVRQSRLKFRHCWGPSHTHSSALYHPSALHTPCDVFCVVPRLVGCCLGPACDPMLCPNWGSRPLAQRMTHPCTTQPSAGLTRRRVHRQQHATHHQGEPTQNKMGSCAS